MQYTQNRPFLASPQTMSKEYTVERILDYRRGKSGKLEFKVEWEGYPLSESTWEPEEHLVNCTAMLKKFKDKHQIQSKPNIKPLPNKNADSSGDENTNISKNKKKMPSSRINAHHDIAPASSDEEKETQQSNQPKDKSLHKILAMLQDKDGDVYFKVQKGQKSDYMNRSQAINKCMKALIEFYHRNADFILNQEN